MKETLTKKQSLLWNSKSDIFNYCGQTIVVSLSQFFYEMISNYIIYCINVQRIIDFYLSHELVSMIYTSMIFWKIFTFLHLSIL